LNQIVGVRHIASPVRQPALGPPPERRQVTGHQAIERLVVPGPSALEEMDG